MLTDMPRSRTPSREEAHLLMSVVHKAHINDNHTTHHDSSRALPPLHNTVPRVQFAQDFTSTPNMLDTPNSRSSTFAQAQQYYDLLPRYSPPVSPPSSDPALKKKVDNKKGNRLAAKRCREKKKQYIAFLEERCGYLEASIRSLAFELQEIQPLLPH
eukprot:m.18294 g.18294  ORF g.18294 m.18294 type:complete len:157 (-) comp9605_c0_seq2:1621-2091(-)